jgi:hypothetical protein
MRKTLGLLIVLLLTWATCVDAAITQVQKRESENSANVASFTLAYSSGVTAGNELFAVIRLGNNSDTPITVSDNVNAGNWTQAVLLNDATNGRYIGIYYKENTGAGTPTVTLSYALSDASLKGLNIYEYSGLATSSSIDQVNSANSASTSTPTSGNITTTQASELILAAMTFSTSSTVTVSTEGSGFTQQHDDALGTVGSHDRVHVADQIVAATNTYSYAPTLSGALVSNLVIASFKAPVAGGCTPTMTLLGVGRCG